MFRKLSLAAVAAVSLGAAALAPTPAAAWGFHGGYGWHGDGYGYHGGWYGHRAWWGGPRFYGYGVPVSYGYGGCYVRQLVPPPGGHAGTWSTAATELPAILTLPARPRPRAGRFCLASSRRLVS